ncbi:hypothetical protein ABZ468_55160, partial [Streptomyces sp. NPDC005708]|uniref:hypothetical protein n=1 Tax=Streptomyces sp. NPDC005708 TaxID=3154564 RepID=UPI0033C09ADF
MSTTTSSPPLSLTVVAVARRVSRTPSSRNTRRRFVSGRSVHPGGGLKGDLRPRTPALGITPTRGIAAITELADKLRHPQQRLHLDDGHLISVMATYRCIMLSSL